ncbi:hypothetical protein [Massilicoli timonensis]|uniref:hypothetical protein n=1 Tax=Massilicoli timonensis TaxID=2015901 RepID=UPI00248C6C5F|nr:hypothetical protein [Massilicoli timonensis]
MKLEQSICYGSRQAVMQNLIDAGCSKDMIDDLMKQLAEDDMESLLQMLEKHRACLLSMVHQKEKQIDCVDYLVYQIKRSKQEK